MLRKAAGQQVGRDEFLQLPEGTLQSRKVELALEGKMVERALHYGGPICQDTLGPIFKESSFPFKQAGAT